MKNDCIQDYIYEFIFCRNTFVVITFTPIYVCIYYISTQITFEYTHMTMVFL
jgi:hypothetical protein